MHKITLEDAVALVPDGAVLMVGGFMGVGTPEPVMDELVRQGKRGLTVIGNDTGKPGIGSGKLIAARLVAHVVASHVGLNPETQRQIIAGEITAELVPQGTLIERIRAGGYGLGGVLTATGIGTDAAAGKDTVVVDGRSFLIEKPLRAHFGLVHAHMSDHYGNLAYALTARNFNPLIAMACDTVIVCANSIVPVGVIPPDQVMTPAPLVDYLITHG